jgi:hypothetical protein
MLNEQKDGNPRLLMTSQKFDKPVIAAPDLMQGKQSPLWPVADYWGLLRRFTPRNDRIGDFWRVRHFWLPLLMGVFLFFIGCAGMDGDHSPKVPGLIVNTGALLDQEKTWRGMVLCGAFGPPIKGKISEISRRVAEEAIRKKMPMVYLTTDGFQRLEVQVLEEGQKDRCTLIQERIYQDGTLAREEIKQFCE